LGALIAATGITSIPAVEAAIDDQLAPKLREKNKKLLNKTYEIVKEAL
ncbi:2-oxoacid:acceptor oxidoreductase, partial [Xanthomonas citri pv. citri]|nr:2-oxoacid:acceptor oxidoreductase [Xanthomonas citri pv. citri]